MSRAMFLPACGATILALSSLGSRADAQFQGIVGPVSIAHEGFGRFITAVPDVNGDGAPDVAVSTAELPFVGPSDRVFIYSGRTGAYLRAMATPPAGGFYPSYRVSGLAGLDDVNGDGRGDVAGSYEEGRRVLVFSGATGQQVHLVPQPPSVTPRRFGASVAALPDIDGDGRGDFVVGAPATGGGLSMGRGAVYIFSGATQFLLRTVEASSTLVLDSPFGTVVAGSPDLDSDGRADILVAGQNNVSAISGATGAVLFVIEAPMEPIGYVAGFGASLASGPDVNGDGTADILIGAPMVARPAPAPLRGMVAQCGRAYVYSGKTGALIRALTGAAVAGSRFGTAVAGVPDLTGDGVGDLVVGAAHNMESMRGTGFGPGTARVFNGATGALVSVLASPNPELGGGFGTSVLGLPDVNGNGRGEVVVGAPFEDPTLVSAFGERGRVYFRRF